MSISPSPDLISAGALPAEEVRLEGEVAEGVFAEMMLSPEAYAFFFDVDGTLLDIAPKPDGVKVPADLLSDLQRLHAATDGAVALVSGRAIANLDALFHPVRFPASGIHGAELRVSSEAAISLSSEALPDSLRAALAALPSDMPAVLVEDKGAAVAVHYRAEPDLGPDLKQIIEGLVAPHPGLGILAGHFVFEVKPTGHDKGAAVHAFMRDPPFADRTPVFIGDDVTDEAGFAAVRALGGTAISIGRRFENVEIMLSEPGDVRALVRNLIDQQGRN
ncbi:MAG: trehalose-phosphatase [Rhizobiales bacterium 32-66-8]|nr:MAG: trehalose-phosphatase [Rhizobiales bacterium 32-66-8]